MRRTRKWAYVAQEAARLADLGLSPLEIAKRLEVRRSTVQRWMASGKLTDTRRGAKKKGSAVDGVSPDTWASSVRAAYALDATDDELVKMGEAALAKVHDPAASPQVQLNAMGRFIAIVKQLALVARAADDVGPEAVETPKAATPPPVRQRRPGADPRTLLMAVK